jgi:SAM-dependent methyltransferase
MNAVVREDSQKTISAREQHEVPAEKMPGHWLLARMGKHVLRPGGLELTRQLLARLAINEHDDVVEFAPGLGVTTRMTLERKPHSYIAVERNPAAAATVERYLSGPHQRCITGTAEETGLPDASASVVYGEAMLSMQPASTKSRIIAEAARLLRPGGRYGIHELCLVPDEVDEATREAVQRGLSDEIHVGVRPLTIAEWRELLEQAGLKVTAQLTAPMHLLEPRRVINDEGLLRAIRFAWNVAWHVAARRRVLAMRRVFRTHRCHLAAIALVATRNHEDHPG